MLMKVQRFDGFPVDDGIRDDGRREIGMLMMIMMIRRKMCMMKMLLMLLFQGGESYAGGETRRYGNVRSDVEQFAGAFSQRRVHDFDRVDAQAVRRPRSLLQLLLLFKTSTVPVLGS